MNEDLRRLGQVVREQGHDEARSEQVVSDVRERFELSAIERRRVITGEVPAWWVLSPRWVACAAVALTLMVVAAWTGGKFSHSGDANLQVTLESEESPIVGRWIKAEVETKQLSFSDGTSLSLHPHTKLRVQETTKSGATVELGEGRTLARIEPLEGATWRFLAGPFKVRVTGTEFDLAWNSQTQVLELALHQGSVLLSGPTLSGERQVRKGQFVRVDLSSSAASAQKVTAPDGASESLTESQQGDIGEATKAPSTDAAPIPPSVRADKPAWRAALAQGDPAAIITAVEAESAPAVLQAATEQELWIVARAARLGGRPLLARDVLLALRNKHGTGGQTAYLLGKVHADQLASTTEAISWFETYLKEQPSGALAEQALGRLVELQAGSFRGKRAARRYLAQYPEGSYADFCRSQLR